MLARSVRIADFQRGCMEATVERQWRAEERDEMVMKGGCEAAVPFDTRLDRAATIEDVDDGVLSAYARAIGEKPSAELLARKGLLEHGWLTNAGVILFAKEPGRFIIRSVIEVDCRIGRAAESRLLDGGRSRIFDMPVATALPAIRDYVCGILFDEQVAPNGDYPVAAWMEGLMNAIAHRDYAAHGDRTCLCILKNKMVIENPGLPPRPVMLDNMRYTRYSRNPLLARVLTELGWMTELGVGVNSIYEAMGESRVHCSTLRELGTSHLRLAFISRKPYCFCAMK